MPNENITAALTQCFHAVLVHRQYFFLSGIVTSGPLGSFSLFLIIEHGAYLASDLYSNSVLQGCVVRPLAAHCSQISRFEPWNLHSSVPG